ncbi:choice-of-anchor I family protein [Acinetobacter tianfuensis]|uniref:Alkaline phosphatase n=1 Tax=Acinetobacter tianfuensis TaxID=2419603 RepID=A0A3A8EYL1_9GAMM|nr:choice-of-anchor I family protein [Acinetobacter tianfuensis]RKG33543.1 alkaline phosphatase [Acinetobacter tianfuensis]
MNIKYSVLLLSILTAGLTGCGGSDHGSENTAQPPVTEEVTPNTIELQKIGAYESGIFGASAAEIPAYDPKSKRLFVVNAQAGVVDVLDFQQPEQPKYIRSLDAKTYLANSEVNSVAVNNGIVALAVQAEDKTQHGIVAFFKASDLSYISQVSVGALPDMLTFTPDGKKVLAANEGEPNEGYAIDPEGSVSIIDISDIAKPSAKIVNFKAWDSRKTELENLGVRIFGPDTGQYADVYAQGIQTAAVSKDLEPEYIAVSADGKTAWVSLQENNAIAVLDIAKAEFSDIFPMGYKDHSLPENALDAGDRDCVTGLNSLGQAVEQCDKDAGMINIKAWPGLYGMYMPDAIAHYQADGKSYLVTANEGDAREWLKDEKAYFEGADLNAGYAEEIRVKHLFKKAGFDLKGDYAAHLRQIFPGVKGAKLDSTVFGACKTAEASEICADNLIKDSQIGRLTISWTQGFKKDAQGRPILDADGKLTYDKLYAYGGRSFSIVDPVAKRIVWDSGSEFERKIAELFPQQFNSNHESFKFDDRSDNKGPEPEGLAIGAIGKKTYAFIGLERASGIMVYDISNPAQAQFVQYFNHRDITQTEITKQGDLGPEGLIFIAAQDSPNGKPLLAVGNEVSGTTAVYQIAVK